jgi:hypothetical protein
MHTHSKPPSQSFTVQPAAACDGEAEQLWNDLHGPSCAATRPGQCLVARNETSGRLLGIARYYRTFPPEDGCGAVLVAPEADKTRVGEQLLRSMAGQALRDGIRTLGTLVGRHDTTTMELLRRAAMPVNVSPMSKELYVEMDLVTFAASDNGLPLESRTH